MEKGRPNQQAAAADLPDDLIVEILARLPAGPLCRFKCVSRSWRALISDPAHRARLAHTLSGFFVFSRPHSTSAPSSWSFIATQRQSPPLVDTALSFLPPSHGEIEILDSCNGLLLLRCSGEEGDQQQHPFYVVCNPATGEWVALPQPSQAPGQKIDRDGRGIKTTSAALGFDPVVSSCFYVFQLQEERLIDDDVIRAVEIYSSETGAWVSRLSGWRGQLVFFAGHKIYFKGFLYLTALFHDEIASVDTKGQTWSVTRVQDGAYTTCDFVGHCQGHLLYVLEDYEQPDDLSICVLEDHANEESTVKHNVRKMDLFGPRKSRWPKEHQTVAFHPDGNLIFFYHRPSDRFMCYDMNRKDVHVICNVGGVKKPCEHMFLPYVPYYSRVLPVSPN